MKTRYLIPALALICAFAAACEAPPATPQTPPLQDGLRNGGLKALDPSNAKARILSLYDRDGHQVLRKSIGSGENYTCPHDAPPVLNGLAGIHSTGFTTVVLETFYVDMNDPATVQKVKELEEKAPETFLGLAENGQVVLKGKFSEVNFNDQRQFNGRLKLADNTPVREVKTCGLQILATNDPSAITGEAQGSSQSRNAPMLKPAER